VTVRAAEAIRLEPAFDDPTAIRALIERAGPFEPLAKTAQTNEERETSGAPAVTFVPPWFRRNLATNGDCHVDGVDAILHNPHFIEAARRVFPGSTIVEPTTVYVNVMAPTPFPFVPHNDIPVFRGADRWNCPVWLLQRMLHSRLFEDERVTLATAVTWFYTGTGGSFYYWPDGPDGQGQAEHSPFGNVAIVADNESVVHGVGTLGDDAPFASLSFDAMCVHDAASGDWMVHDQGESVTHAAADVRITISWKAEVFADEAERAATRQASRELPIEHIVSTFLADLAANSRSATAPDDPLHDLEWATLLEEAYPSAHLRIPR
jgi:hypothetical protein